MCYEVLVYTIDDVINFKIYLQLSSKPMAERKKERKTEIQKVEYTVNEKSFLRVF